MPLTINGEPFEELKIGLFVDAVPNTVEEFLTLCRGSAFKRNQFTKIVPKFMMLCILIFLI